MPFKPEQIVRRRKRKRVDDEESERDEEAQLRRKLHHVLRELRKVVKKTKTFEVQKTLKKLKDARRKDPESDIARDLGAQMEILKRLSYDQLAHSALMTKLKKDRVLSANPFMQVTSEALASNLVSPGVPGTPTAKVQCRILSSKVVASEVVSIIETLKAFLHLPAGSEEIGGAVEDYNMLPDKSKKRRTGRSGPDQDAFSSRNDPEWRDSGNENISDDKAVAEADDGWESGTVGAPSESGDSLAGTAGERDSGAADFPLEDSENEKSQSHGSRGLSEFLPSLSVGFARGDSGSEFSDGGEKMADGARKNRRGQRARRAIWERKFGKNANHIKVRKQQESKRRVIGSNPADRRSGGRSATRETHGAVGRGRVNSDATKGGREGVRRQGDGKQEEGLHPSWEAKRKERMVGMVPLVGTGTKIVFSE